MRHARSTEKNRKFGKLLRLSVRCAEGTLLSIAPDFGVLI